MNNFRTFLNIFSHDQSIFSTRGQKLACRANLALNLLNVKIKAEHVLITRPIATMIKKIVHPLRDPDAAETIEDVNSVLTKLSQVLDNNGMMNADTFTLLRLIQQYLL